MDETLVLEPERLRRYADAIVKASLAVTSGDSLIVHAGLAHRELAVALAEAGYRAGAHVVDVVYADPRVMRAHLEHGRRETLGVVAPWQLTRIREATKPNAARVGISGESEPGYLDGIPPRRIAEHAAGVARRTSRYRSASLDLHARWTAAAWPTDAWSQRVYPDLPVLEAKRRLAEDLLSFCRLTDEDGRGAAGWLRHVRSLARRAGKLTKLDLKGLELRGPGTALTIRLAPGTRWLGGQEETPWGVKVAPNTPTEESFTSPHAAGTEGSFTCTYPLSFQGRLIEGLRGEFRGGRLVRLGAHRQEDRDRVATFLDSDPRGNGRRLGEVALVDATSRIGQAGRTYFNTLLDENAATHIAFGAGFGGTRTGKPARGINRAAVHLDVMIGSPDFEVTGITATGRRVPVLRDGLWRI